MYLVYATLSVPEKMADDVAHIFIMVKISSFIFARNCNVYVANWPESEIMREK